MRATSLVSSVWLTLADTSFRSPKPGALKIFDIFEAFLRFDTKGYLKSLGQAGDANAISDWEREVRETTDGVASLDMALFPQTYWTFRSPLVPGGLEKWQASYPPKLQDIEGSADPCEREPYNGLSLC
jgi:hypothetical protein